MSFKTLAIMKMNTAVNNDKYKSITELLSSTTTDILIQMMMKYLKKQDEYFTKQDECLKKINEYLNRKMKIFL